MRVGIIGLGSIGKRHAANALAMGHQVYFFDPQVESQYDIVKCSHFWMMSENEAVLICTPASTHASVAQELLSLGYTGPLFCEKPLALSSAECDVFRSWPSPVTMTGYMLRHHHIIRLFEHATFVHLWSLCDMRSWPGTNYGSPLLEMSHEIDLALKLGARELTFAEVGNNYAELMFGRDYRVSLQWAHQDYERRWQIDSEGVDVDVTFHSPKSIGDQMYVDELAHFLACVEKQEPTITPFADGIRVVGVCEAALKLAKANP